MQPIISSRKTFIHSFSESVGDFVATFDRKNQLINLISTINEFIRRCRQWSPGKGVPAPSWAPLTPAGEREERESSKKMSMPKHRRRRKIVGVLNSRCGNASTRWAASFGEFWDQMAKYKFTSISPNFRQILGWVFEPVPSYKFVSWKSNNIRKTIKFQAAFCCWFCWNNIHFDGRKYFKMYKVHPKIFTESYSKRWDETMKISITPSSDFAGVLVAEKKGFFETIK